MHLQHKVRYGLAALATTIGSVFSWNTYQFLTNEPVYPLLSYSGFDMGSPAASLANPTCNSNIAYIACGSDIYLLAGLLAIALITGIAAPFIQKKKTIFAYITTPVVHLLMAFFIVTTILLVPSAVLVGQAGISVANTKKLLNGKQQNTQSFIYDAPAIQKGIEADVPQLYEGYEGYAFAALSQYKPQTKDYKYPFFHSIMIPIAVYLAGDINTDSFVPYAYLPEEKTLLVFTYNEKVLSEIIQPLAKRIVRVNFPQNVKPEEPEIKILKNGDYEKYENDHIKTIDDKYKQTLVDIDNEIAGVNGYIAENNSILSFFEGTPEYGEAAQVLNQYTRDANNYLYELQGIKAQVQANYEVFKKNPIGPELQAGVFNPPNSIVIRYDNERENRNFPVTDSLGVFIHELLHYHSYSYAEDLDSALNEGMTDYFTAELLSKYMQNRGDVRQIIGYEAETQLIRSLARKIPDQEMKNIYFSQSTAQLETAITTHYPSADYASFISLLKSLFYTSPKDDELKAEYLKKITTVLATDSARKLQK